MDRQAVPVIVHATRARATNVRRACAADLPLLLYLAWVTALLGLFASIIYGLMQPTVIPNAGLAGYKAPGLTNLFLHKPDSTAEDMERAAIDAAETENRDQGIEPLLAFAAVESAAEKPRGSQANAATGSHAKQANPKPKRVANRATVADSWRSSWNSSWHSRDRERGWNSRAGRTGSRPLWTCDC